MSNQQKITYLKKYREAMEEINIAVGELEQWQEIATRISPQYSGMPHGSDGTDKLQTAALEIAELKDRIQQNIHQAQLVREQVRKLIDSVPEHNLRSLLLLRYIEGKKWEEIAVEMRYDYRWVLRLHSKALNRLDEHAIKSHTLSMI